MGHGHHKRLRLSQPSDNPHPVGQHHSRHSTQMLKTCSKQTERGLRFSSAANRYEPKPRPRQHRAEHVQSVLGAMISISFGAHTPAADPGCHSTLSYATNRRIFRADPVLGQQQTGTYDKPIRRGRHEWDAGDAQEARHSVPVQMHPLR